MRTVIRIMLAIFAFMTIVWSADYFGSPGLQVVLFFATFVLAVVMAVYHVYVRLTSA